MANVLRHLPELEGMELGYIQGLMKSMDEEEASLFAQVYRARRKDPQMILILTLLGFFGFAGLHGSWTSSEYGLKYFRPTLF